MREKEEREEEREQKARSASPSSSPQRRARHHLRGQWSPPERELVRLPGAGRQGAPAAHLKGEKCGERAGERRESGRPNAEREKRETELDNLSLCLSSGLGVFRRSAAPGGLLLRAGREKGDCNQEAGRSGGDRTETRFRSLKRERESERERERVRVRDRETRSEKKNPAKYDLWLVHSLD